MQTRDVSMTKVDKSPLRVRHRRALREKLLRKLNIREGERTVDLAVDKYFAKAESAGKEAKEQSKDPKRAYVFLANAFALFLLASEPQSRASKLVERLYSGYLIKKHEKTRVLGITLKARSDLIDRAIATRFTGTARSSNT